MNDGKKVNAAQERGSRVETTGVSAAAPCEHKWMPWGNARACTRCTEVQIEQDTTSPRRDRFGLLNKL